MELRDWALILFTVLGQMSVGSFLVLGFVHFYAARRADNREADRMSDRALIVIGPVLVLGLIASLFHLGDPLRAYRAVANLGTSWLSREILFGVVFAVLGGLFAVMQWRKISSFSVRNVVALLAALVGLGLVYNMSRVYMLPTQPAWNTAATPILFYSTTLLLGLLTMGAAFVANYAYLRRTEKEGLQTQVSLLRGTLRWIAVLSVILVGVELVVVPLQLADLARSGGEALASARMMIEDFGLILGLRLALAFLGAGIFGVFLYRRAAAREAEPPVANLVYAAFAFVLVAEVLGRFLFYATRVGVGL